MSATPGDENHEPEGEGGEEAPGSEPSPVPLQDSAQIPVPAKNPGIHLAHSAQEADRRIAQEIASIVESHFDGVKLGVNLPDDWPRERYLRVLKAEANWRVGIMTVPEISRVAEVSVATVYEWAKTYHWPKRDDIAKLTAQSVQRATVISIAMKAKEAARRLREAREATSSEVPTNENAGEVPSDVVSLDAERDARPMSDEDAQRAVVVEQATAAAAQETITNLFVEQLTAILETQQELADFLVAHTAELTKSMRDVWATYLEKEGKKKNAHVAVREEVAEQVKVMRQLVAMSVQAVGLQRRVWMLDAGNQGEGGGSAADIDAVSTPEAVQRDSYEYSVRMAEARGEKLTR